MPPDILSSVEYYIYTFFFLKSKIKSFISEIELLNNNHYIQNQNLTTYIDPINGILEDTIQKIDTIIDQNDFNDNINIETFVSEILEDYSSNDFMNFLMVKWESSNDHYYILKFLWSILINRSDFLRSFLVSEEDTIDYLITHSPSENKFLAILFFQFFYVMSDLQIPPSLENYLSDYKTYFKDCNDVLFYFCECIELAKTINNHFTYIHILIEYFDFTIFNDKFNLYLPKIISFVGELNTDYAKPLFVTIKNEFENYSREKRKELSHSMCSYDFYTEFSSLKEYVDLIKSFANISSLHELVSLELFSTENFLDPEFRIDLRNLVREKIRNNTQADLMDFILRTNHLAKNSILFSLLDELTFEDLQVKISFDTSFNPGALIHKFNLFKKEIAKEIINQYSFEQLQVIIRKEKVLSKIQTLFYVLKVFRRQESLRLFNNNIAIILDELKINMPYDLYILNDFYNLNSELCDKILLKLLSRDYHSYALLIEVEWIYNNFPDLTSYFKRKVEKLIFLTIKKSDSIGHVYEEILNLCSLESKLKLLEDALTDEDFMQIERIIANIHEKHNEIDIILPLSLIDKIKDFTKKYIYENEHEIILYTLKPILDFLIPKYKNEYDELLKQVHKHELNFYFTYWVT